MGTQQTPSSYLLLRLVQLLIFKGSCLRSCYCKYSLTLDRGRGEGLRAGNLNLSLRLQIQSVGQIRSAIILTERQVNLRGTFKTDLGSSQAPLPAHRQSRWRPASRHVGPGFGEYGHNGGGEAEALSFNMEETQLVLANKMHINLFIHLLGKEYETHFLSGGFWGLQVSV